MASSETVTVPFFKKKGRGRPTTSRKRSESPPLATTLTVPAPSSSKSQVVLPSRKQTANLLSAGTKRTVTQREEDDDDYGDDADDAARKRDGPDVKWTAEGSHLNTALEIIEGDEAEALLAKRRRAERKDEDEEEVPDDGLYRGQQAYKAHIKKNKEVPKAMRVGPQRSNNSTIRTVTIVDYQPDVCKDYKETGFCGYGDSCKFLHDRGTYLQGWQLDKLAANPKKDGAAEESDTDTDDEDIPFACLICRKPYTEPVVTRCSHYFCSACAIKRFARTPKCAACGSPTGGIFNRADKIIAKLKKSEETGDGDGDGEGEAEGGSGARGVQIEGLAQAASGGDVEGSDDTGDE